MLEHQGESTQNADQHEPTDLRNLVRRLRQEAHIRLDDDTVIAIAEATGTDADFVRQTLIQEVDDTANTARKRKSKSSYSQILLAVPPEHRKYVLGGVFSTFFGLFAVFRMVSGDPSSLFGLFMMMAASLIMWNAATAQHSRQAAGIGAVSGGLSFFAMAIFHAIASLFTSSISRMASTFVVFPFIVGGALLGIIGHRLLQRAKPSLGIAESGNERRELLRQLMEIQDRLRASEQQMTFLSLDIVGSTRLKEGADPLAVEFTFTEYHRYVEEFVKRNGGRVHSTAGDGVTVAFESPANAFQAARRILAGMPEFNMHRNRLRVPVQLRAGIHHGEVLRSGPDLQDINFSHVIDLAAHLQKEAPVGGVMVSLAAASLMPDSGVLDPTIHEVQNVKARCWQVRNPVPANPAVGVPPPPSTPTP
jgi:class 3 adenylate cyclase